MKKRLHGKLLRASVGAGAGALATLALSAAARAADATAGELTTQTSTLEAGVGSVSRSSFWFGEYNGLQDRGAFGIGNLDVRGGGRYDSDSATRWSIKGHNLGLDTRDASAEYGKQGSFRFGFGYDELRRNYTDSYQTPYLGVGSSNFTLPSNWLKPLVPQVSGTALNYRSLSTVEGTGSAVNGAGMVKPPTAAQLATLSRIFNADVPDFRIVDLSTKRRSFDTSFAYDFGPQWQMQSSWRREHKDGLKAQGAIDDALNGNSSVTLPILIDETTDQYNLNVRFTGERGFAQLGYYGSMYDNQVDSIRWADPNDPTTSGAMSSAPSNRFHQLTLTGGYHILNATQLVASGAYGINTQNDAFLNDPQLPLGIARGSLDGRVITKSLSLKLTSRPQKRLTLGAGLKFDERDNQTPVTRYIFQDVNEPASTTASPFNAALGLAPKTLGNLINIFDNRPHSRNDLKADLNADFVLTPSNSLAAGYTYERVERHCAGTWIECENATQTKEDTLHLELRSRLSDELNSRIGYSNSQRSSNYNPNAWLALVPMANVTPGAPVTGANTSVYGYLAQTGLTGWGPIAGFPATPLTGQAAIFTPNNNIVTQSLYASRDNLAELPGMRRFNVADRSRDALRASMAWDASERLSFEAGADYNRDDYGSSVYGLQRAASWALNFDASLNVSDHLTTSFFYSHENLSSRNAGDGYGSNSNAAFVGRAGNTVVSGGCYGTVVLKNKNGKIDPCLNWWADHVEEADTVGLAMRDASLMSGKVDLAGNLVGSWARTHIGVLGGSYANSPFALAHAPVLAPGDPAVLFTPAADMPEAVYRSIELRLDGLYHLAKSSSLHFSYGFKHLSSSDYVYDGLRFGTLTTVMPTGEQAPSYSVHVFGVSYLYTFQ
jgi:MtrB/PioB family decaheme-associated outer membrane protein